MLDTRHEVEAGEAGRCVLAERPLHSFVVLDRVDRADRRVCPPVIEDQLTAAAAEGAEIGMCVERRPCFLARGGKTSDGVEGAEVPMGIAVDHVCEVAGGETNTSGFAARRTGDPTGPAVRIQLSASRKNGRNGGAADLLFGEDCADRFDLRGGEAATFPPLICRQAQPR